MELQVIRKGQKYYPIYDFAEPSWHSKLLFSWIHKILELGARLKLENSHLHPLPNSERVANERLTESLKSYKLFWAIIVANSSSLLYNILLGILSTILLYTGPIYIQLLIEYLNTEDKSLAYGMLLALTFTLVLFLSLILTIQRDFLAEITGLRIRNSLFNIIYNKSLTSTNLPEGLGVNLIQVDASKVYEFFWNLPSMIGIPIQIAIGVYLIYNQVGNAVWVGIGVILISMFANLPLKNTCQKTNEIIMKCRDERIQNSSQLFTEIKMIKAYSWEDHFLKKIQEIRRAELLKLRYLYTLYSINIFYCWSLPNIVIVVVFGYYTMVMGQELNSSKAFVTLNALLLLQSPITSIPGAITRIIELVVSLKRVQRLIDAKPWIALSDSGKISLRNCDFAYGEKIVLKNLNLNVNEGEFVAVIGSVGSGKSSLLLGLMGEIPVVSGEFYVNSDIAYAPSLDSWLLNATLRENVIFGREFKDDWYWKVIEACCLLPDIAQLHSGDKTEIGERGINLSGGQKARICLARAVYSEKQVYLLDDPLSSVDNHVANHIFKQCFQILLKGKTRILVTNRHNFLDRVDRVLELKDSMVYSITERTSIEDNEETKDGKKSEMPKQVRKLIEDEERRVGYVDIEVYLEYFKYSGSYKWIILATFCLLFWMGTKMAADIFLKEWASNPNQIDYYFPLYIALRLGGCIFTLLCALILNVIMSIRISFASHEKLMNSLIQAPINLFYDVTPLGRILNRLTKDVHSIDEGINFHFGSVIGDICHCIGCTLMALIYFPYLLIIIPVALYPAIMISRYYIKTSRELTRLESISRSPMLNHFTETLSGTKFIRVFGQTENFILENQSRINKNMIIKYNLSACKQWARLYLGFLAAFFLCALFMIAIVYRHSISVGIIGLCLTYTIPLPGALNDLLMNISELENQMVAVERVKEYTELLSEQPYETVVDKKYPNWPLHPGISFQKVVMRYRPYGEVVLKELSFNIPAGARVGITGRTGSGKSSLFLALLRIIELESGVISINGVNIALLGLRKLREAITLIPQDPLVFNGTMKENLDPFSKFSDLAIKKVLDEVGLKFGLDYEIKNSGQNISIGERQLLSLSRALICNTKVLLFDEATAGVDPETDKMIQNVIRGRFHGCTILTIAHRLETISDSDLVVVLADGKVIEIGEPNVLMMFKSESK